MSYASIHNSMTDVYKNEKTIISKSNANHIYSVIFTAGMTGKTKKPVSDKLIDIDYGDGSYLSISEEKMATFLSNIYPKTKNINSFSDLWQALMTL